VQKERALKLRTHSTTKVIVKRKELIRILNPLSLSHTHVLFIYGNLKQYISIIQTIMVCTGSVFKLHDQYKSKRNTKKNVK